MSWMATEEEVNASIRKDNDANFRIRKGSDRLLKAMWRHHAPILRSLRGDPAPQTRVTERVRYHFEAPPSATALVDAVAAIFGLSPEALIGRDRFPHLVDARGVLAKLLRERNYSYPQIGVIMGNRDHSTVINLLDKFDIYERRNPLVSIAFEQLRLRGVQ